MRDCDGTAAARVDNDDAFAKMNDHLSCCFSGNEGNHSEKVIWQYSNTVHVRNNPEQLVSCDLADPSKDTFGTGL